MGQISQAGQNPGTPTPSAGMRGKSASEEKLSQYFSRDHVGSREPSGDCLDSHHETSLLMFVLCPCLPKSCQ